MIPFRYNLRSLLERRATSAMTVLGVGMVAMIFVILFGFIAGLQSSLLNAAGAHNYILVSRGAPQENASRVPRDQLDVIRVYLAIAQSADGEPLISPEVIAGVNVSRDNRVKEFVLLRGVTPIAYHVHSGMHLVSGRWPKRGSYEWVVGQKASVRFPYLEPGSQFHYDRREWTIVGVFSDHDSARESEILTDHDDLKVDRHWTDDTVLHVMLKPGTEAAFQQAIKSDGRLRLDAIAEPAYYAAQSQIANQLRSLGLVVAICLGIGAVFGGMNTMYTAVARREREIGVLRVLGFPSSNILVCFLLESAVLGLTGGIAGMLLAFAVASATGLSGRLMSVGTLFFSYHPTPAAIAAGVIVAAIIGILGGMFPAWRASRTGIIDSIREA
jgi:putative ABC transport system permease protein